MKPTLRSLSGLGIAVIGLPVFLGLLACLPVPIGNPEKSRIDPDLTGMWIMDGATIVLMEPYDKRTWLMSGIDINRYADNCDANEESEEPVTKPAEESDGDEAVIDVDEIEDDEYAELVAELAADTTGCYGADEVALYKAWLSTFGGEPFMTWEPMGAYDEDHGFVDPIWYGFRVDKVDTDNFHLWMIDIDSEPFEDLEALEKLGEAEPPYDSRLSKSAQRAIEKVLRRNADNDDIYSSDSLQLRRVNPEDAELFLDLVEEVVTFD